MKWRDLDVGGHPFVWERPKHLPKVGFCIVSCGDAEQNVGVGHFPLLLYADKGDPFGAPFPPTHQISKVGKESLV